jgi:DNA-binding MarR family transcriptional regulator
MALDKELYCHTLGCRMGYAVKAMMRLFKNRLCKERIGLTLEQYFILNILDNEEGLILQDLAEIVDRDKSAVLRHIYGLEENYFVARTTDPEDKRRKLLLITKRGMNVLEKARKIDKQVNEDVTKNIGDDKLRELKISLSEIYERALKEPLC